MSDNVSGVKSERYDLSPGTFEAIFYQFSQLDIKLNKILSVLEDAIGYDETDEVTDL